MAQQERKEKQSDERDQQGLQRGGGRGESLSRDPFATFWGGRDPFAAFLEPFGIATRNMWPFQSGRTGGGQLWSPQLETVQRGDEFIIRADLPGLSKDDVTVDLTEDSVTIEGERREEHKEHREGYFRSERSYGSFRRTIPLPEGAITDSAKAQFSNGVLEIIVQAPPRDVSRGRRLEIGESSESGRSGQRTQTRNEKDRS